MCIRDSPTTGELLVAGGEEITEEVAKKIQDSPIESVEIRSVLTLSLIHIFRAIAQDKMVDLNCFTVEAAMTMVAGTARSMGIAVKGEFPDVYKRQELLDRMLADEVFLRETGTNAGYYVTSNAGATDKILSCLLYTSSTPALCSTSAI